MKINHKMVAFSPGELQLMRTILRVHFNNEVVQYAQIEEIPVRVKALLLGFDGYRAIDDALKWNPHFDEVRAFRALDPAAVQILTDLYEHREKYDLSDKGKKLLAEFGASLGVSLAKAQAAAFAPNPLNVMKEAQA